MRRAFAAAVVVATLVSACGAGATRAGATAGGVSHAPRFVAGACPPENVAGPRVTCGTLSVPARRTDPDGPRLALPVAILHSGASRVRPDPIVYVSGGPGYPGLTDLARFAANDVGGDRDVILFDQRGTGASVPNLACPEVTDATWAVLGSAAPAATEQKRILGAFVACHTRLVGAGVDLSTYTSAAIADDLADLRRALHIRSWNVLAASYGTTIALDEMRRHRDGIRSVVLDSVLPTTVEFGGGATAITLATRAFAHVFAGCAADASCHARYPTLALDYQAMVRDLDATPIRTTVTDATGRVRPVVLTGEDIVAGLYDALYDSTLIGLVPSVVELLHEHQDAIVTTLAAQALPVLSDTAEGMAVSVVCADRERLYDPRAAGRALRAHPETATLVTLSLLPACRRWNVPPLSEEFNDPVHSGIPTLVLADQYDPVTPPAYGRDVARTLTRSQLVEFPGLGHTSIGYPNPCPTAILHAFVDAPTRPVDQTCVTTMSAVQWR